jgi:phosphotriesterase-related protein
LIRRRLLTVVSAAALICGSASVLAEQASQSKAPAVRYEDLYQLAREAKLVGKVQTVLGTVAPDALGFTLMHEHLFVDFLAQWPWPADHEQVSPALLRTMQNAGWTIPVTAAEREFFARRELTLSMVNDLRRGLRSRTNLLIDRENEVAEEVARYRAVGGRTIVDVTPNGLGRDPVRLKRVAQHFGVTIVAGTGWYRWPFQSADMQRLSLDALTERMVHDIVQGDDQQHVPAGLIGEIGLDSRSLHLPGEGIAPIANEDIRRQIGAAERRLQLLPVEERDRIPLTEIYDEREIKVLRAAARASRLTGAALTLHAREPWLGYLDVVRDEGVTLDRVIISHAHPHFMERELLVRALRSGVILEADYMLQQYATRAPLGPFEPILDGVAWAIRNGHRDQVLLSLDLCNKLGQQRYGGGGYTTLQDYVFPYLRTQGVSEDDIQHVMVDNPRRLLTIVAPQRLIAVAARTLRPGSPELP